MSVRITSLVWENSQAKGTVRLVLLAIADFADDNGRAYPSVQTLARKTLVSERTIQYTLGQLVKIGELRIDKQTGPLGCNVYNVKTRGAILAPLLPAQDEGVQSSAQRGCNPAHRGVQSSAQGGAIQRIKGVQRVAPEPSVEPSVEPSIEPNTRKREGDVKTKQIELGIASPPKADSDVEIPLNWSPAMREAWANWLQYRREIRHKMTPLAQRQQLLQIAAWSEEQAIANIANAIRSGWRGLYEARPQGGQFAGLSRPRNPNPDPRFADAF